MNTRPKVIVVAGATATGKTSLAINLARRYHGEVISADSRQVYKGLDVGSAKVTHREMDGVPHHMLDVVSPMEAYSVAQYQQQGTAVIEEILSRGNVPIICGGTGFYIDSLIYHQSFPPVLPNEKLRNNLEPYSVQELHEMLKIKDPRRANTIDANNKARLIRALEIVEVLGSVPESQLQQPRYDVMYIGLHLEKDEHEDVIKKRILERTKNGVLQEEIEKLLKQGVDSNWLEKLGLEYQYATQFVLEKISYNQMIEGIFSDTKKYIKRQKTWFKRNGKMKWYHPLQERERIYQEVELFLKK